ncbi:MAG: calcium-binding protein, partial [Pseudomonadota bacterium]|nr:calcium-binding protein [Pseudomonadota bacterium]
MADQNGTAGDDALNGTEENDRILGLGGNDTINGLGGNDRLEGGDGNDILDGGAGVDVIIGGNGDDTIIATGFVNGETFQGNGGTDFLDLSGEDRDVEVRLNSDNQRLLAEGVSVAMQGIDGVVTGEGDDIVFGTGGANVIRTGGGNDFVNTQNGTDEVDLGAGDDTVQDGGDGADVYNGGAGRDTLDYSQSAGGISIKRDISGAVIATGGRAAGDTFSDFEIIRGSNRGDTIEMVNGLDTAEGLRGNDVFIAGAAAESYDGGADTDAVDYIAATEGLVADLSDQANNTGFAAGDTYVSIEELRGTLFDDTLVGSVGNDRLFGKNGDDLLIGGAGADRLEGGDGIDTVDYSASAAGVTINLERNSGSGGDAQGDVIVDIENVIGSAFG